MLHLEVAVAAPIYNTLTYSYSGNETHLLLPGIRLLVPLGRRQVTGYLLSSSAATPAEYQIKEIVEILDQSPLFPEKFIDLFRWMAAHYRYPLGEVIKNCLPGGLTAKTYLDISLSRQPVPGDLDLKNREDSPAWLQTLLEKGSSRVNGTKLTASWKKKLAGWEEKGLVKTSKSIVKSRVKPKTETYVFIKNEQHGEDLKVSEKKTLKAISSFPDFHENGVPRKDLNKAYKGAGKALKELHSKDLVELREIRIFRDPLGENPPNFAKPEQLTEEQELALDEIIPALQKHCYQTFLVHGVTGCGKTEIYLRAAEETLQQGRSVLVLVPEITLASQMTGHFFSRFGPERLALLHSGLSQGERLDQWQHIQEGRADIVIGARSAIFAPLENCGLIIVDEEHDPAYKQEDKLRYQARDLAVLMASRSQAVVLLGSATPSLTSFQNSEQGKYRLLSLTRRIDNQQLPEVSIIDLRAAKKNSGSPLLFSEELLSDLQTNLERGEQSILFLNRRGYASFMLCLDCGNPVQCRRCHISLTLHKNSKILACHHCGYSTPSAIICPICRSHLVKEIGFGTEKVEEELQSHYPEARIARLDRDTTIKNDYLLNTLNRVRRGEVDILVGTQMISKGHHFPNITLVGVLWADAGLGLPDFKAGERTFQLLTQVTGRAGRGAKKGRVIIQTNQPEHYAITCAREHDYHKFYQTELERRRHFGFPPYSRLACLTFSGKKEENVKEAALETADRLKKKNDKSENYSLLGPVPSPLSRLKDNFRWQILLKSARHKELHAVCELLTLSPPALLKKKSVSLTVDIDPENML